MNGYLAIDNGEGLRINIIRALIAAWLDYFKRSRVGVQLNKSNRK